MIRWPAPGTLPGAFAGSRLQDWLPARSVFEALEGVARQHGERTALAFLPDAGQACRPQETSYAGLLAGVARTANLLRDLGVGPGDTVAYLLPALTQTQFLLWGAETAGIALPINPLLQAEHIAALLRAADAKALVAFGPAPGTDVWEKACRARRLTPCVRVLMRLGGGRPHEAGANFATAFAAASPGLSFAPPG